MMRDNNTEVILGLATFKIDMIDSNIIINKDETKITNFLYQSKSESERFLSFEYQKNPLKTH